MFLIAMMLMGCSPELAAAPQQTVSAERRITIDTSDCGNPCTLWAQGPRRAWSLDVYANDSYMGEIDDRSGYLTVWLSPGQQYIEVYAFDRWDEYINHTGTTVSIAGNNSGGNSAGGDLCFLGASNNGNACVDTEYLPNNNRYAYDQWDAPERGIDLRHVNSNMMVAPNFALWELYSHDDGNYVVLQPHAVASLQRVRNQVGGLYVNSGYRSPLKNDQVGGSYGSRHTYGDAFDLDPSNTSLWSLADTCWAEGAGYVEVYDNHVHCDWRNDGMDPNLSARVAFDGPDLKVLHSGFEEGEPAIRWTAFDQYGNNVELKEGSRFQPPADAVEILAEVGGQIERRVQLSTLK